MTNNNNTSQFIVEEASLTRLLGFTGEDYSYQKDKMEMHTKSTQYGLWLIVTNRDIPIPRPKAELTNVDLAIMELNPKASYTVKCSLSRNEYRNIYRLKTSKEI